MADWEPFTTRFPLEIAAALTVPLNVLLAPVNVLLMFNIATLVERAAPFRLVNPPPSPLNAPARVTPLAPLSTTDDGKRASGTVPVVS